MVLRRLFPFRKRSLPFLTVELISSYLDRIMVPIVKSLPSYIKDTNHALEIFRLFKFSGENKLI